MIGRRLLAAMLLGLAVFIGSPAAAQKLINSYPAEKFALSPGGVDLRSGRYAYSETDLSIGPKDGGLSFNRSMPEYAGNHANPFGSFSHNWDIYLLERPLQYDETPEHYAYRMTLQMGGRALTFEGIASGTGFAFKSGGPLARLTLTSGGTKSSSTAVYTAELPDGSVIVFRPIGGLDCANEWPTSPRRCASVSEMTEPDGTKYTFTYAYDGGQPGNRARLKQVISNRGYALLIEGTGTQVTKACVLNLAVTTIPANGLCPASVPTTSYSYSGGKLTAVTGADGAVYQFTYTAAQGGLTDMAFIKPGQGSPWLTNRIELLRDEDWTNQEIVKSQTFADGRTYAYAYSQAPATTARPTPPLIGGRVTNSAGKYIEYVYGFPIQPGSAWEPVCPQFPCGDEPVDDYLNWVYQTTAGPVQIVDELGRTSTADYCDPVVMAGMPAGYNHRCAAIKDFTATDPEGGTSRVIHDGYGNVTKVTQYPKPGSSAPPIVTEAAYAITNIKTQTKPLWTKDANGNQTDYTYDAAHGGVLTETGPAVNGVRPQKRYTYVQRYAWISDGRSEYVQAATPVWLLAFESFCRTSAWTGSACAAGTTDEVITAYDYGPNSGPNNLWLRGVTVTADGVTRRTCYRYDPLGRRISETTPNANLASCP